MTILIREILNSWVIPVVTPRRILGLFFRLYRRNPRMIPVKICSENPAENYSAFSLEIAEVTGSYNSTRIPKETHNKISRKSFWRDSRGNSLRFFQISRGTLGEKPGWNAVQNSMSYWRNSRRNTEIHRGTPGRIFQRNHWSNASRNSWKNSRMNSRLARAQGRGFGV